VDLQKQKLRDMGLGDAVAAIEREEQNDLQLAPGAMGGLASGDGASVGASNGQRHGEFVGQIIKVESDHVVQKVNRDGKTATHSLGDMDGALDRLQVGEVVTIKYRAGRGEVSSHIGITLE